MLKVGDYVMKTVEGVCKVDQELTMSVGASGDSSYFLLIPLRDAKSRVYIRQAESYEGIRPVMTREDATRFLDRIHEIEAVSISDDKEREPAYREALRSLDPARLVAVLKTMADHSAERVRQGKKRTALDDRYSKLAEEALYQELAFALGSEPKAVKELVQGNGE